MRKLISSLILGGAALASLPAQAVVVTFGGQNTNVLGGDYSGLTSNLVPVSNLINPNTGIFIETFDRATANPYLPSGFSGPFAGQGADGSNTNAPYMGIVQGQGCSINSYGSVNITVGDGSFAVRKGSVGGIAATPANDTTCFGFGPAPAPVANNTNNATLATVRIDYANFINTLITAGLAPAGSRISYLGLYYGSIDTYNNIAFYNGNSLLTSTGILADGVISGQEILTSQGGTSGNQTAAGSNVYVNLNFGANETFTAFEFRTSGVAFEMDNIVVGLTNRVPEPGSLALLGLGLLGLASARRRRN